ncbi:hypothetical protein WJX72_006691 [[Myrmecia] bisecta]|uniref:Uncharacterized protein n=1 Tax=[Myrmecia] bisecta TaxID=41462 RepID=A0AAW1PK58_9CHLO
MVRACQLEEDISAYVEGLLQKRIAAEVGLLVGKLGSGTRNFILLLIKSPQQNGVEPVLVSTASTSSKKTASKGRSAAPTVQVQLDDEWLAVHAHNVSRMLPGGLSVIGLYLFCPESGLAGVTGQLTNALQCIGSASLPQGDQAGDMLLLHIASDSRKWSLKELPPASSNKAAALRPCEIRHVPLAANFAGISCRMAVDLAVPVTRAYVHKRETVATAVDCLKEDLAASLKARLDLILLEDGEDGAEGPFSRAVAKSGAICVPLPARVFFPVKGDIMLCDYLAPGETEADARERCNEMLALQIVKVHCVERPHR